MREVIESCRGQISYLLKKDGTLSVLERNFLKNCDYQLQCMYQYLGDKEKENSFQYALDNMRRMTSSTTGINNKKARELINFIVDNIPGLKTEAEKNTSPRGEKRDASQVREAGSSPKAKRQLSFRSGSLFGLTKPSENAAAKVNENPLGKHRKG